MLRRSEACLAFAVFVGLRHYANGNDVLRRIADVLAVMVTHIREAERLIGSGDKSTFAALRPIRLQMAGAATGCFVACQHVIDRDGSDNSELVLVRDGWALLAGRMREIAGVYQSPKHPEWLVYKAQARSLMADLLLHINFTRRVIAMGSVR